jgi:hypothetical protein
LADVQLKVTALEAESATVGAMVRLLDVSTGLTPSLYTVRSSTFSQLVIKAAESKRSVIDFKIFFMCLFLFILIIPKKSGQAMKFANKHFG